MTDEEDTLELSDIKETYAQLKKHPQIVAIVILMVVGILLFQLGHFYGFKQAYKMVEDHYKDYESKFCICYEEPVYSIPPPNLIKEEDKK